MELVVHIAGRFDQVCFKLYATVDQELRSKHADDLRKLVPTSTELLQAARWTRSQDPSEGFRQLLVEMVRALGLEATDDITSLRALGAALPTAFDTWLQTIVTGLATANPEMLGWHRTTIVP